MRVLVLTYMFPNPHVRLSGLAVYQGVRYLQPKGYDFRVVYPIEQAPLPLRWFGKWRKLAKRYPLKYMKDDIRVDFPRYLQSTRFIPHRYWGKVMWSGAGSEIEKIAREFKPDLVWVQSAIPNGWGALQLFRRMKIPYVLVIHGWDLNESVHFPGAKAVIREIYENAALVIPISERLEREAREVAPGANYRLIYLGIDPDSLIEARKERARWLTINRPPGECTILSVASLIKTKGLQYNLQAFSILSSQYPGLRYRIVGDGPYGEELQRLAGSLGISDKVTFLGQLEWAESKLEMARSDIFSMPSYKEGFGLVYLESMALGIPTIACADQVPELIHSGVNGYLVESHNVYQIVNVWERLLNDSHLRARVGEAATKTVYNGFTWEMTAVKYDSAFSDAVKGSKKHNLPGQN